MRSLITITTGLGVMLVSCTNASNASNQGRKGADAAATALVDRRDWGKLHPFYVFHCSAHVETEAGAIQLGREYGPDGRLISVHAIWDTPMLETVPPRIQAVFNSENGRDFDLGNGYVGLSWEFIPALRPTSVRSRMSIGDLPFAPDPHKPPIPGMVSTLFGTNSVATASLLWRDFIAAARNGAVNVRVDVAGAPPGWKNRLFHGYLSGLTAVGNDALMRSISTATLASVETQLKRMAAQTDVHRPEDVPSRCAKADQIPMD